jgi:hypothetical protein
VVDAGATGSHENHGLEVHDKFMKDIAIYSTVKIKKAHWPLWKPLSRFVLCLIYELLAECGCFKAVKDRSVVTLLYATNICGPVT